MAVAYFTAQSCLHIVVSYLRQPELDQNIPYLLPYHQPVPSCGKFSEKIEILRKWANSVAGLKILCAADNCGPYSSMEESSR